MSFMLIFSIINYFINFPKCSCIVSEIAHFPSVLQLYEVSSFTGLRLSENASKAIYTYYK